MLKESTKYALGYLLITISLFSLVILLFSDSLLGSDYTKLITIEDKAGNIRTYKTDSRTIKCSALMPEISFKNLETQETIHIQYISYKVLECIKT